MTLTEMETRLSALLDMRFRGVRSTNVDGVHVAYGSDAELAAAIMDLERRIGRLRSDREYRRVRRPYAVKDL